MVIGRATHSEVGKISAPIGAECTDNLKQETNKMTEQELKLHHPELYKEFMDKATNDERERLKALQALRGPETADLVDAAIASGSSAASIAIKCLDRLKTSAGITVTGPRASAKQSLMAAFHKNNIETGRVKR